MKSLLFILTIFLISGCASVDAIDSLPLASGGTETSTTTEVSSGTTEINSAPSLNATTPKLLWDIEKPAISAGWTAHLISEIKKTKLVKENPKSDINCFLDSDEERTEFWAQFISAIAKREADFDTNSNYKEDFTDSEGKNVISRGVLQISYESGKQPAYKCKLSAPSDLNKPLKNLSCGVGIVNFWTKDPMTMGNGLTDQHWGSARYWSVTRKFEKDKETKKIVIKRSYKFIKNYVESLPICKKAV